MYKNKRYRIGSSSRKPLISSSTISSIPENLSTISSATNPPITSTPNEPIAGPSNVLTDRENLPPSQPSQKQQQPVIISNDDDFIVPSSQVIQPSRYISQRSALRSQISNTQQTPMSYFESVLSRCGVNLTARNSDISYTLNCDHLKFVVRLRRELTSHPKHPENIQTFLSGMLDTMKNSKPLTKILSGCTVREFHLYVINFYDFNSFFICIDHIGKHRHNQTIIREFDD